jgi:hypothetical protein
MPDNSRIMGARHMKAGEQFSAAGDVFSVRPRAIFSKIECAQSLD